ncbi:hypothetical protein [Mycolicibacterium septicum]|uniref:hypothetical protein n=1 Tax=Mycolicibacterium septicum TaxID=98668 RepID=UPI0023624F25|nr:hypothetical protein [Mycolicibacterium septicum]
MLWIIGGWGNRPDSLESAVDRLQRSLSCIPDESGKYGPWGYWQRRHPDDEDSRLDFVPIDAGDAGALADAIVRETEQVRLGPNAAPGAYVDLSRPVTVQRSPTSSAWFKCIVRVGFIDQPRPLNHIAFEVDDDTDERTLMGYMSALVDAWHPDRLGVLTVESKRAQGHKGPEVAVGRLTYVRNSIPLNTSILDDEIEVAEAEGGCYIRVPGTIENPSLHHILQVRRALGYPTD